jgi:hypothetical protein
MLEPQDFGSSEAALRYIQEKSEDIEKAVIPQSLTILVSAPGMPNTELEAGMVLHMLNGHRKIIHPVDAELILNDGILHRMKIKIELFRGK